MKIKFNFFVKATAVAFSSLVTFNVSAQKSNLNLGKATIVSYSKNTNLPNFIKFNTDQIISVDDFNTWAVDALKLSNNIVFKSYNVEKDELGFTLTRFKEYVSNFPVEGSMLIAHAKEGHLISVNGDYFSDFKNKYSASITEKKALKDALKKVNAVKYKWENKTEEQVMRERLKQPDFTYFPKGELVIVHKKGADYTAANMRLAYKFNIYAEKPLSRAYVFVDANTGEVIDEQDIIHTADVVGTGHTKYSGTVTMTSDNFGPNQYRLRETGRGNGIETYNLGDSMTYVNTDFTNSSSTWNVTGIDQAASDAHWGAEMTYDYYMQIHNRNSIDNAGLALLSYVHYGIGYDNAFWDGTEMTYGDGDGTQFYIFTGLDVCGHEITHGLTAHTAALSGGEADALNEGFSDIFGTTIETFARPNQHDWIMGAEITPNNVGLRDMSNPKNLGQPNCYLGINWDFQTAEPHNNNGPLIYWYYLICQGGSGTNDLGNLFHVTGITMNEARMIAFRGLTVYLTPSATYDDTRTATIQAATDIYGACSPEVIAVTNAWYAVGVGNLFTDNVIANFTELQNSFCSAPAVVNFTNTSLNATTYHWDFGDGNTSILPSPSHTYTSQGNYTVTLHTNGIALCATSDSITISNCITINNIPSPVAAACTPGTKAYCCSAGITNVTLNTINYSSLNAMEGYKNFTCADSTVLTAGDWYNMNITTGILQTENVKAWIDYNNDGQFNNTNELILSDSALTNHSEIVYTSLNPTLNTPLRMRVMSDGVANSINSSCDSLQTGQAEDYTVYFKANTLPPICNFSANKLVIPVGGTVNFNDLSLHAPTGWHWTFAGGTPASSTTQNPAVTYSAVGTYLVKLVVTNSFGADSLTQTAYIDVENIFNTCTNFSTTVTSGIIYDSGGEEGNYSNNESCIFLIHPLCAASIVLSIDTIDIEESYDSVFIYDGSNTLSPLLFSFSGNMGSTSLTANSGKMFIRFHSDEGVNQSGFKFHWNTTTQTNPPAAAFSSSPSSPMNSTPIHFTDLSTNNPTTWLWKFGDLGTSTVQNPFHTYSQPGIYTVKLITSNCVSSDSTTSIINILSNGVDELQNVNGWKIYPNPSNGTFTMEIELSQNEKTELKVMNALGQVITSENHNFVLGNNKLSLNLSGSPKGIYFVQLRTSSSILRQRIVID